MSSEKYEQVTKRKRTIFLNNLIGGVAWGIGATLGLAVFLAVFGFIMRNIDVVPFVGSFVSDTYNYVIETNPKLQTENK